MKTVAEYLSPSTNKKWYEEYPKTQKACTHKKSEFEVLDLKAEGKRHLEAETTAFNLKQSKSRNSEYGYIKSALSQGTSSDKVAATIVLLQDSPKHNLSRLATLVGQVKASKQNQCNTIITALRDVFLSDLLHPTYKLMKFEEQDFDKLDNIGGSMAEKGTPFMSRNKLLAHWYFEDQLKEIYEKFIISLSQIASTTVDTNREKAVGVMNDLLMGNAEQEHKLLDFLVNKIGDPSNKVASKVIFCLNKLLFEHSNMKVVVLREVEKLLFRNNVSSRAQYYAICLLTQFVLDRGDVETANNLIDVYFSFFKASLKKGEPDSRMMAAILTGVNRAYRFSKVDSKKLNDHIDSLYKVVHVGSFNVSLNALSLLFQVVGKNDQQMNRFYSTFYRKLLDPQIGVSNKRAIFLNLLYRVLKNDHSVIRLKAFIKRIFQIVLYYPANMTCATLYVVSQVLKSNKNANNIIAFIEPEIKDEKPARDGEKTANSESDSEASEAENESPEKNNILISNVITDNTRVISKKDDEEIKEEITIKDEFDPEREYNPFCRNPLGSGANNTFHYELFALENHFHPSVALFARNIKEGKSIDYSGDPLEDLNLIRFLDRYVFKNPKKLEDKKVTRKGDPLAQRAGYVPKGMRSVPVDSEAYLNEHEDRIPVDELFLYRFLKKRKDFTVKAGDDDDEDNESVNSEEFNDMLDGLAESENIDDLDIAGDIVTKKRKKKDDSDEEGSENDDSDEDEDDFGEENEDFDEDMEENEDFGDGLEDEEMENMNDDFSDIDFDGDDTDEDALREELSAMKNSRKKSKKNSKQSNENVFMAAEEFAEMMEAQGLSKTKHGGSGAVSTRDGAGVKQLKWEENKNKRPNFGRKGKRKANFKNNKKTNKKQRR